MDAEDSCAGGIIWLWADFSDPMRIFNPKPFFNQKGLLDYERNEKLACQIVRRMYRDPESEITFPGKSRIRARVLAAALAALTMVLIMGSLFSRIPETWRILFPEIPRYSRLWLRALIMSVVSGFYLHLAAHIALLSQPAALPGLPVESLGILRFIFNSPARPLFFMAAVFVLWLIFSMVLEGISEWKGAAGSRIMFEVSLGVGDPLAWILPYPLVATIPFLLPAALGLVHWLLAGSFSAPYSCTPFATLAYAFLVGLVIIFIKTWLSLRISFYGSYGRAFSALVLYETVVLIIAGTLFGILLL
jgi:hypothetical protein